MSEFGLDPASPLHDPAYASEIEQGLALARADGLQVIVSLQAQPPAGAEARCPLPDAAQAAHRNSMLFVAAPQLGLLDTLAPPDPGRRPRHRLRAP